MSILKIKDSQGNWVGIPSIKGDKGDKGNGISSAILNDDYTLTLTFTDGTTYTTPSIRGEKGEQGEPATDMEIHICSTSEYDSETRIPTIANPDDKTFYLVPTEDGTSPDLFTEWVYVNNTWEMFGSASVDLSGYLTDVTVNGTSVVTDGVAEIPVASRLNFGVVKIDSDSSKSGLYIDNSTGFVEVIPAVDSIIKTGTNNHMAIAPNRQDKSVFYGLAKVAGHDEKDSTLPVGQYTDEAKSSIQDMLDVPSTSELKEINDSKADVIVESATGDIVSFNDGADDMPLQSLIVDINPVQDLHGYDSPWVAGGGKNKFDESSVIMSDLSPVYSYNGNLIDGTRNGFDIYLPNGTYTVKINEIITTYTYANVLNADFTVSQAFTLVTTSLQDGKTFTIADGQFLRVFHATSGVLTIVGAKMQIKEGSTATDWTPYENICPISGWTGMQLSRAGKNLFGGDAWFGRGGTEDRVNRTITGGTTSASLPLLSRLNGYKFKENTQYTLVITMTSTSTATNKNTGLSFVYTDGTTMYLSSSEFSTTKTTIAFTSNGNKTIKHIGRGSYSGTKTFYVDECGFFEGALSIDDFEPYQGQTIPISWQTEAGTVYGGKLDVLSGVLRVEMVKETFSGDSPSVSWNASKYARLALSHTADTTKYLGNLCNEYKISNSGANGTLQLASNAVARAWDNRFVDADTMKSILNDTPVEYCYYLAEPIEIQLAPHEIASLLGANNIWADTGDTSVEYCADTEMYIEKVKPVVNVDDVQINGTSIVTDGVANVPVATTDSGKYGVVKVSAFNGLTVNGGVLTINSAYDTDAKAGTNQLKPLVSARQHMHVFYGLAKAAGVDMASSSNAVGTYTDEAKTAIKQMLGVHDTIDSFVEEVTGTDVTITGQPSYRYNCGELYSLTVTPPSSGTIDFRFTSGSTPTVLTLPSTVKMPEWWVEVETNTIYEMCITDGIYCGVMSWAI